MPEKDNPVIINKYLSFITQLNPPKWWKVVRFFLHWASLPIKLLLIFVISVIMHIYMLTWRTRDIKGIDDDNKRKYWFLKIFDNLPLFETEKEILYVNRVPVNVKQDGSNHNTDHQASRHGTFAFVLNKLGLNNKKVDEALRHHIQGRFGVIRGYKFKNDIMEFNANKTSGDQLLGVALAMSNANIEPGNNDALIENYEIAIRHIIDNDYALLSADGTKKSERGFWSPGIETAGAQALTILAAISVCRRLGIKDIEADYNKLLWKYGYGLLSMFPTTFVPFRRNYSNDHNCIIASYILHKMSKSKLGKLYWGLVGLYVWSLSYKWYNAYFTGLVKEMLPWAISNNYVKKCEDYLYEEEPKMDAVNWAKTVKPKKYPVMFNDMNQGEFWPDEEHRIIDGVTPDTTIDRSGLGWFAAAAVINPEKAKEYING